MSDTQHKNALPCVVCRYVECRILFNIMLSDIMLNVVMLSFVAPLNEVVVRFQWILPKIVLKKIYVKFWHHFVRKIFFTLLQIVGTQRKASELKKEFVCMGLRKSILIMPRQTAYRHSTRAHSLDTWNNRIQHYRRFVTFSITTFSISNESHYAGRYILIVTLGVLTHNAIMLGVLVVNVNRWVS